METQQTSFFLLLKYSWHTRLHWFHVYDIVIWQVSTWCYAHHKCSLPSVTINTIIISLIIFRVLYLSSLWPDHSITGSLYLPHLFTHFTCTHSHLFGNYQFVLCIMSLFLLLFVSSFRFHMKVKSSGICLALTYFA